MYKLGNLVKWPSQNLPDFTHFISTNELRKVVNFFCQKATGSWEFGPEITIFVWRRYLKYNLLEMLLPAHGYFNVPGHFLGLDYMTKKQIGLWCSEKPWLKSMKIKFSGQLWMLMSQYLSIDFYCISESPPYTLSKTIKIPTGNCWHFLL